MDSRSDQFLQVQACDPNQHEARSGLKRFAVVKTQQDGFPTVCDISVGLFRLRKTVENKTDNSYQELFVRDPERANQCL